jgi:hypothetical protein
MWRVKDPLQFLRNCISVLSGSKTWVGYGGKAEGLPEIKDSVVPAYFMIEGYEPAEEIKQKTDMIYAREYTPGADFSLLQKNFRFLGRILKKDFAEK